MKSRHMLIGLLILAWVLIDLVVYTLVWNDRSEIEIGSVLFIVFLSTIYSQVGLVALWAGAGRTPLPWRMLAVILIDVAWGSARGVLFFEPFVERFVLITIWSVVYLILSFSILTVFLCVMPITGRLIGVVPHDLEEDTTSRRPWQFSIGYLLSWMTVLAVVMGVFKCTFSFEAIQLIFSQWQVVPLNSILPLSLSLATCWAILGTKRPRLRIGIALGLVAATIMAYCFLSRGRYDPIWFSLLVPLLILLLSAASLWVVRVAGYRVVSAR